jgi:predicted Zn-dependent peptidase
MKAVRTLFLIVALALAFGTALAQSPSGSNAAKKEQPNQQRVKFKSYQFSNGLRLLLAPDESETSVALNVTFDVGSRNERQGFTGLANLAEHIMLENLRAATKDTQTSTAAETSSLFEGTFNQERTSYFASFPASRLEQIASELAQVLRATAINQDALDKQRALIREERLQSDNKPYSAMDETLLDLIYSNFAYRHSQTGSPADLDNLTLATVRDFFKTYYAPNNTVISIAGNFDERKTKKIIETYFKGLPRGSAPPPVDISQARLTAERRRTISDKHATQPFYYTGYLTTPSDHADWYALNLLADILGQGSASRLHLALVAKNLALSVPEGVNESRAPGLFRMGAKLPAGGNIEMVESIIDAEVARIQNEGVTEAEMLTARAQERQYSQDQLRSAQGKANFLARTTVYYKDPQRINNELARLLAVTKEDVQRVARKYLTKTSRAVVIVQPAAAQ